MTAPLRVLGLEPAHREHTVRSGRENRRSRSYYLALVVDGVPLSTTVHERLDATDLNGEWPQDAVASAVQELLGRRPTADLPAGRVRLLVCGECGDLACGALTARLDVGTSLVTWSDFLWETGYQDPVPVDSLPEPLSFDRAQYEAELSGAVERVALLPESEPRFPEEPSRRSRRWPWQRRAADGGS